MNLEASSFEEEIKQSRDSKVWVRTDKGEPLKPWSRIFLRFFFGKVWSASNISVSQSFKISRSLKGFSSLINLKKLEAKPALGTYIAPLYLNSLVLSSFYKAFEKNDVYSLVFKSITNCYMHRTRMGDNVYQFDLQRLQNRFEGKKIDHVKAKIDHEFTALTHSLNKSFPKHLEQLIAFVEISYNLLYFVEWRKFLSIFGSVSANGIFVLSRKNNIPLASISPYLIQIFYVISKYKYEKFDFKELERCLNIFFSDTKHSIKIQQEHELTGFTLKTILDSFREMMMLIKSFYKGHFLKNLITVSVKTQTYLVSGVALKKKYLQNLYVKDLLTVLNKNINLYYQYRSTELSIQKLNKFFKVEYKDLLQDQTIYNNHISEQLFQQGADKFIYAVFNSIIYFYFTSIYERSMKLYTKLLVNELVYVDKSVSIKFYSLVQNIEDSLKNLASYTTKTLAFNSKEAELISQFLSGNLKEEADKMITSVNFRIKTVDLVVKKYLTNTMGLISHFKLEVEELKEDIQKGRGKFIVIGTKLPSLNNEGFLTVTEHAIKELNLLLSIGSEFLGEVVDKLDPFIKSSSV